jgi:CheY-like chemotaxis protein
MGFDSSMPTAIIIDDDKVTTQIFTDVLKMIGVRILASGFDGKDAVRLYKKYSPDIVFTDIMMPENDGFYALKEIRKLDPHAKVVAVTADFTDESATRLKELNISAVVYKPFDIQDIKKVLFEKYQIKIRKDDLKKVLKEEKLVVDLELAVKKEEFKKQKRIHRILEL